MKTSNQHSSGRRTFFRTSGAVIAGLGLPVAGISETGSKQRKGSLASDSSLPVFKYQVDYVVVGGGIGMI